MPPAFGCIVVHHHIEVAQAAGIAEFKNLAIETPVENDAGIAERAIADQHRDAADGVIDDLVPEQDA